jgi:hypothetical protein
MTTGELVLVVGRGLVMLQFTLPTRGGSRSTGMAGRKIHSLRVGRTALLTAAPEDGKDVFGVRAR